MKIFITIISVILFHIWMFLLFYMWDHYNQCDILLKIISVIGQVAIFLGVYNQVKKKWNL